MDVQSVIQELTCNQCGNTKPVSEFNKLRKNKNGYRESCKVCRESKRKVWVAAKRDHVNKKKREYWWRKTDEERRQIVASNRGRVFAWKLRTKFGITLEQFYEMAEKQNGVCAICGRAPEEIPGMHQGGKLYVDHNHDTGVVRGLLCNNCNAGIGYLGDDVSRVRSAVHYLEMTQEK